MPILLIIALPESIKVLAHSGPAKIHCTPRVYQSASIQWACKNTECMHELVTSIDDDNHLVST